jgi:hypothetical protein
VVEVYHHKVERCAIAGKIIYIQSAIHCTFRLAQTSSGVGRIIAGQNA